MMLTYTNISQANKAWLGSKFNERTKEHVLDVETKRHDFGILETVFMLPFWHMKYTNPP